MLKIEEIKITDCGNLVETLNLLNVNTNSYHKSKSNVLKIYSITEIKNADVDVIKSASETKFIKKNNVKNYI